MIPCTQCYMKSGLPRSCLDAFFCAGDGNCRQVQVDYNAISSSHVCSLTLRKKERKEAIKGAKPLTSPPKWVVEWSPPKMA